VEFFNRSGEAVCYVQDGEHLYLWNGKPVGYIDSGRVFSFRGRVLGWMDNGWLYDRSNRPALFADGATGGPVKPARKVKPVKGVRGVRPVKGVRQVVHVRAVKSNSWSSYSDATYFSQ